MRRRVVMVVALALAATGPAACGTQDGAPQAARTTTTKHRSAPAEDLGPVVDTHSDRWSLNMLDDVTILRLAARSGRRADHRVPAALLRGRHDAGLVRAAIAEIWTDVDPGGRSMRTLNPSQRAVYALAWADEDIADGGFSELTGDNAAAPLLRDLHASAIRAGAPPPLALIYAQARAFAPNVQAEGDWAPLDARYAMLQRHRDTSIVHVLARYIAHHPDVFSVG